MSQQKENKPVVIHGVLRDEYERIGRMVKIHRAEIAKMTKGVVREKRVQGRVYSYLHFRDSDGKVKDVHQGRRSRNRCSKGSSCSAQTAGKRVETVSSGTKRD